MQKIIAMPSAECVISKMVCKEQRHCHQPIWRMLKYRIAYYLFTNMVLHVICSHMRIKTCSGIMYSVFASVLILLLSHYVNHTVLMHCKIALVRPYFYSVDTSTV